MLEWMACSYLLSCVKYYRCHLAGSFCFCYCKMFEILILGSEMKMFLKGVKHYWNHFVVICVKTLCLKYWTSFYQSWFKNRRGGTPPKQTNPPHTSLCIEVFLTLFLWCCFSFMSNITCSPLHKSFYHPWTLLDLCQHKIYIPDV